MKIISDVNHKTTINILAFYSFIKKNHYLWILKKNYFIFILFKINEIFIYFIRFDR